MRRLSDVNIEVSWHNHPNSKDGFMFHFKILLLLFSFSSNLQAQSLSTYIELAVDASSLKIINEERQKKLSFAKETAGLWENPSVGFEYGQVKNTGITGSLVGATIEQSVPIQGNRFLDKQSAQEKIHQSKILGEWQINEFKAEILKNFLMLWVEREKITHAKHRVNDLAVLRNYLANRKFSSPQQKSDAYLIKKKIEEIEYQLKENSFMARRLEKALSQYTRTEIKNFTINLKNKNELIESFEKVLKGSPKINELRESLKKDTKIALKKQKRQWIPNLNLGYAYQKENVPGGNLSHAVGLSFSLPIFNTGNSQVDEVKAQMRIQEAKWNLEDMKRQSQIRVLKERFEYNISLAGGPLKEKETAHEKELKRIKAFFLKGLINAQTYLDTEEISHDLHYRQVRAVQEVIETYVDASLFLGKEFELKKVIL